MEIIKNVFTILSCYAMGCFVSGYYLVRAKTGKDLRQIGSGSVGAHNVSRVLGKKGYVVTALLDIGKGVLTVNLARYIGLQNWWLEIAALAVVIGHLAPAQLCFRGGKGVATSYGTLLSLDPNLALLMWAIFIPCYFIFRNSALAVVTAYLTAPFWAIHMKAPAFFIAYLSVIATIILITHRRNFLSKARS